jgi:hypothetical protein
MSTTIDPYEGWSLGALEPAILDLRTALNILGHLIDAHTDVDQNTWQSVEDDLNDATGVIQQLWQKAWEQRIAEDRAHEAALAAAKAERAAPGSEKDRKQVESLWKLLRSAASVAADECADAGHPLVGWRRKCDDISGAVIAWLGDQVAKAADEVLSALMGIPATATKLPEVEEGG